MKIQRIRSKPSKTPLIITFTLLVATVLLCLFLYSEYSKNLDSNNGPTSSSASDKEKDSQKKQEAIHKQEFLDSESKDGEVAPPSQHQITDESISLDKYESSTSLSIVTKITGFSGEGSCKITLSSSGKDTIYESAKILYQPEFSSCEGFSIPKSKLSAGDWLINLTLTINGTDFNKTTSHSIK